MRACRLALLLLLVACSSDAHEPTTAEPTPAEDLPAPTEPAQPARAPLDPSSPCGRAQACCEAYARAIDNVIARAACEGPAEAASAPDAEERCDRMREGWRLALEHHPREEPPQPCR